MKGHPTHDIATLYSGPRGLKTNNHPTDYEDSLTDDYANPHRSPSPPHASGGAYYPPPPAHDPEPDNTTFAQGFTQHPNVATTNLHDSYEDTHGTRPYNPQDYASYPPPPPGPPPNSATSHPATGTPAATTPTGMPPPPTGGYRPGHSGPADPGYVSESPSSTVCSTIRTWDVRSL